MVYMNMFNNENIFNKKLAPAYTSIAGGIRHIAFSPSVRSKLERLRRLVKKAYEMVHELSVYYHTTDMETTYGMLVRIGYLAEEIEDLIDDILKERMPPGEASETLRWYLNRINYEVFMNINNDVDAFIFDMEHWDEYNIDYYEFERELFKFIDGTERALKEVENSLNTILG